MDKLREELFEVLRSKGAKLMGIGNLEEVVTGDMKIGISVAVPVPAHIVENLKTAPTMEYYHMYQTLNAQLDEIVTAGAEFLVSKGYKAQANTTKIVKSNENWETPLPHKTVATRAGLGWIGKNCLLITETFGGAQRISSIVTDAPLTCDEPINESKCGGCTVCVDKCPGKALYNTLWTAGMKREEIFNKEICKKAQEMQMEKATGLKTDLCGMCYAVCPYTQKYLNGEK